MAVKLHRCPARWARFKAHPCWRVEEALRDMGIEYEAVTGPGLPRSRRTALREATGQDRYPVIELEDGSWYHDESTEMERTIREGRLMERAGRTEGG